MEERASELLDLPDEVLFAHGGCHVFALTLREFSGLPLLWVHEDGGSRDHLACDPGGGRLLDFFGTFTFQQYKQAEHLRGLSILFKPIAQGDVKNRFIQDRGCGYYAHPDFFVPAMKRANAWITKHRKYFDGTRPVAIPCLCRVKNTSLNVIYPPKAS